MSLNGAWEALTEVAVEYGAWATGGVVSIGLLGAAALYGSRRYRQRGEPASDAGLTMGQLDDDATPPGRCPFSGQSLDSPKEPVEPQHLLDQGAMQNEGQVPDEAGSQQDDLEAVLNSEEDVTFKNASQEALSEDGLEASSEDEAPVKPQRPRANHDEPAIGVRIRLGTLPSRAAARAGEQKRRRLR